MRRPSPAPAVTGRRLFDCRVRTFLTPGAGEDCSGTKQGQDLRRWKLATRPSTFPPFPFPPFHERRRTSIITPYFECYFARSLKRRFAEELTSKPRQSATQSSFSRPPSTNHCKPVICHAVRGPKRTDPRLDQDHHVRIVKLRHLHPTTRAAVSRMLDDPSSIDLPASRQAMH